LVKFLVDLGCCFTGRQHLKLPFIIYLHIYIKYFARTKTLFLCPSFSLPRPPGLSSLVSLSLKQKKFYSLALFLCLRPHDLTRTLHVPELIKLFEMNFSPSSFPSLHALPLKAITNLMAQSTVSLFAAAYAYKDTCISICISAYRQSARLRAPLLGGVHENKHQGKTTEASSAEASVAEVFIAPLWP